MTVKDFIVTYANGIPEKVSVFLMSKQLNQLSVEVVKNKPDAKVITAEIDPEEQTMKIYTDIDS